MPKARLSLSGNFTKKIALGFLIRLSRGLIKIFSRRLSQQRLREQLRWSIAKVKRIGSRRRC
jgi:hypothetical protein